MNGFIEDILVPIGVIVLIILMFLGACIGIGGMFDSYQCRTFGEMVERDTAYHGLNCYIREGDRFIPKRQYERAYEQNLNIKVKP